MERVSKMRDYSISGVDYQVNVTDKTDDPAWDAFISGLPHGHHVQTSLWSQAKEVLGYRTLRVVVSKGERIVGGGQLLIRKLMPFISIAYMSKGPALSTWDPSLAQVIIDELKRAAKANHYIVLALQPATHAEEFKDLLEGSGFQSSWMELAPTATIFHDLTKDSGTILKEMKRQTRQNVRRSAREGMTTRVGTEADLPTFYQLHASTSERQGFTPYPEEYFNRLWEVFSKQGLISLVFAEYQNVPVSVLLLISFGEVVAPKILGWSGEHGRRRPNDALFWGALQWAKERGYHYFDMEGIDREGAELILSGESLPESLRHSPDFFKLGYGGEVMLMPQSYFYVPNLLWRWPYRQIFGAKGRGQKVHRNFERIRRRFG